MRTLLMAVGMTALSMGSFAQGEDTAVKEEAAANAKARTTQLVQDLGLTEDQARRVEEIMMSTELATVNDRVACKEIERRVETTLILGYDQLAGLLSTEQADKLAVMRKEGKISTQCCAPVASKAGCGSGTTSKGGCCAGKTSHAEEKHDSLERGADDRK